MESGDNIQKEVTTVLWQHQRQLYIDVVRDATDIVKEAIGVESPFAVETFIILCKHLLQERTKEDMMETMAEMVRAITRTPNQQPDA